MIIEQTLQVLRQQISEQIRVQIGKRVFVCVEKEISRQLATHCAGDQVHVRLWGAVRGVVMHRVWDGVWLPVWTQSTQDEDGNG